MAAYTLMKVDLVLPGHLINQIREQLFPGDREEHGGVLVAGVAQDGNRLRLLGRQYLPAIDGLDYVPGEYGHRMMTADFVQRSILFCRDQKLAYLAVHNHGGSDAVAFSAIDLRSHERGYPALRALARGLPVGALVFAENAVAGDIWLANGARADILRAKVIGSNFRELYNEPQLETQVDERYDRQVRVFGDRGQATFSSMKVCIVGAGGVGSLLNEYLARLGVGHIVVIDPEIIDVTNLPRVVGATSGDAAHWIASLPWRWARTLGRRWAQKKVHIARRVALQARSDLIFEAVSGDIADVGVVTDVLGCDFIFLAADSMLARFIVNIIVNQYMIPGAQIGSKVQVDKSTGRVGSVFSVYRPLYPGEPCLSCNDLIDWARLQREVATPDERRAQHYLNDDDVTAPSVITLNAIGAALAANEFMLRTVGLISSDSHDWIQMDVRTREVVSVEPRIDARCRFCSIDDDSVFARGDGRDLPTRASGGG